jgi:hypothetical protein
MKNLFFSVLFLIPLFALAQQNSVFSSGDWHKISVEESGIYKLSYNDLQSFGIDVGNIDPQNLSLYGNPAGMLSESMEDPYFTDLQQMAIKVFGEEDGVFNVDDYVLFYGQSPDVWKFDEEDSEFHFVKNIYSEKTHYFLNVGEESGLRIQPEESTTLDPTATPLYYDLLISHEMELVNPGKSGKIWLGEDFVESNIMSFNLNTNNTILSNDNKFNVVLAAKNSEAQTMEIQINGESFKNLKIPTSPSYSWDYRFARFDSLCTAGGENTELTFIYTQPNDSAKAWIDRFELRMKMNKSLFGNQMPFRCIENVGSGEITHFTLESDSPENVIVWNISDPLSVKQETLTLESNQLSFRLPTESLKEFIAFDGESYLSAEFVEELENQNLHNINPPDFLIVTHPDFVDAANQLAAFHSFEDNMQTLVASVDDIYNEFSSGSQDITAIRNFVKYLREKSGSDNKPEYLLLFGDASYDYLNRVENNTNFVPTFESLESAGLTTSYASDQYFGLNSMEDQGENQVSVGRIPVKTIYEANFAVNKIESYSSSASLGNWKNEMMFIADDGDNNLHLKTSEDLVQEADTNRPVMNFTKCYFDFFELIQTENGPRYPEVNENITSKTNDGVFYVNYTGHGSEEGLAFEKVLLKDDLNSWTNTNKLPLWVIASCAVGYFDNPEFGSIGEEIYLKENGGAIALIANSRMSFAAANSVLNKGIIEKFTNQSLQNDLRFGDLLKPELFSVNFLIWNLFGDPALKIKLPEFNVNTTTINGILADDYSDSISPGTSLLLNGQIVNKDDANLQSNFNGNIYLKVFAPQQIRQTLANNEGSFVTDVVVQDSILVEGTAIVVNGEFEISVNLPEEYWEGYGNLKMSYYAENGETDANGFYNEIRYGGEPNAIDENDKILDLVMVFPTVFSDNINVEIPSMENKIVTYRIYNSMGAEVYSVKSSTSIRTQKIIIPSLAKGMYVLNMDTGIESRNFKIFKN